MAPAPMLGVRLHIPAGKNEDWLEKGVFDPTLAAAEKLDAGILLLAAFQVPLIHERIRRYRGVRFMIDHMGLRHIANPTEKAVFRQWPELIAAGKEPNAWIKISLFPEAVEGIEHFPFPVAQRYFKQLYEEVGPDKLIWGSNYPPVAGTCTYKESLDFVREHCTFLSASDKEAILGGNFMRRFGRPAASPSR
jgi:predicted TIM-barrel fold metal-dependent hydrolase